MQSDIGAVPDRGHWLAFREDFRIRPDADFQIRVTGWLGMPASDKALQVQPELAKVPPSIVQCVYGADETDTLCPALANTGIDVVKTNGSHHFDGDYSALAEKIITGWKKEIASRG